MEHILFTDKTMGRTYQLGNDGVTMGAWMPQMVHEFGYSHAEATASQNPVLTELLNRYTLDDVTWFEDEIAPQLITQNISGQISVFGTDALREADDDRPDGSESNRVSLDEIGFVSYNLPGKGLHFMELGSTNKKLLQGGFSVDDDRYFNMEHLKKSLRITKARNLYTIVSTAGNYVGSCVSAAPVAWSSADADIPNDIKLKKLAIKALRGVRANILVVNDIAFAHMETNAGLLSLLPSTVLGKATKAQLEALFGLRIHVTDCIYDSSLPGATPAVGNIWGSIALVAYVSPSTNSRAQGFTFMRTICNEPGCGL